jgi:hypothetical protein
MLLVNETSYLAAPDRRKHYTVCLDLENGTELKLEDIASDLSTLVATTKQEIISQIKRQTSKAKCYGLCRLYRGWDKRPLLVSKRSRATIIYNPMSSRRMLPAFLNLPFLMMN